MSEKANGLLAIWSTVAKNFETDYLHWLTREHVFERVGVEGFRSGCVYRRRDSAPSEYLMLYELDDASVMSSSAYRARLDNPTVWTQRVMPQLQHFRRGGGTVFAQAGHAGAVGSFVAVARHQESRPIVAQQTLDKVASVDRVNRVRAMSVASEATAISTREKSMRTGDEGAFSGALVIDALDPAALARAIATFADIQPEIDQFEMYEFVFCFSKTAAV
ncbi:hypothetical protein [Paraburkholderia sp. 32]|uniref:hypothetical protein n=1 Tax=Paraburkholderia sp. 32 TaxID=2991057 RepID=UPI003D248891